LEAEGANVKTGINISSVGLEGGSAYVIDETDNGTVRYHAYRILVATGRATNIDVFHLEKAGVETDKRGYLVVDQDFYSGVEGVWAIGDVIGGMMFTHKAWHHALLLSRQLLKGETIVFENRLIPFAVFTEPEIVGVGMEEAAAVKVGYRGKDSKIPLLLPWMSPGDGRSAWFCKVGYLSSSGRILGGGILSARRLDGHYLWLRIRSYGFHGGQSKAVS